MIQIAAWTDERGLLIAAKPRKLVVPPALQFVATRLLETNLRVGTADNDINALKNNGSIPEGYTINHYLTDTNAWFLCTDVPNGLKHFERMALTTGMDGDFDTGNVRYKARERYSFGFSDPLGVLAPPVQPSISSEIFKRGLVPFFFWCINTVFRAYPVH